MKDEEGTAMIMTTQHMTLVQWQLVNSCSIREEEQGTTAAPCHGKLMMMLCIPADEAIPRNVAGSFIVLVIKCFIFAKPKQ